MSIGSSRSEMTVYRLFLVPALVYLVSLTLFPFLYSIYISLHSWTLTRIGPPEWCGLHNYARLLGDSQFHTAIVNTLLFLFGGLSLQLIIGFVIALLLHHEGRIYNFLRSVFLLPMMITPIAAALMWQMLYNNEYGAIRDILTRIGFTRVPIWLGDPRTALPAVMAVDAWQWTPMVVLFCLAGLNAIPPSFFEVARVEGGSLLQTIRYVVFPALKPVLLVITLLRGMDIFKIFDLIFMLTKGGPGTSTETMAYYTYRQGFAFFDMGYASALSIVILLIVTFLSQFLIKATLRHNFE